jgi:nucleoside-diphosphate-sugar epimerase
VVHTLGKDPRVGSILGIARRVPEWTPEKTTWVGADIRREDGLAGLFRDADAVIHLAWLFQPTHAPATTWRTNVLGSIRVYRAAAVAGVSALVVASSVGAYSPGPKDRAVDESWPTHGWPQAAYCREKSYLERVLDTYEYQHPQIRVVRIRPGFLFKRESATEQCRLFAGPLLPRRLMRPELLPAVPDLPGMRFQVLHTDDAAAAFHLAATGAARGAFNVAAEPVADARMLADLLGTKVVRLPRRPVRAGMAAAWQLRLLPASPDLFDAALHLPIMDTIWARKELGWAPRRSAPEVIEEFLEGIREGAGMPTAPLAPRLWSGAKGLREAVTAGLGRRP